MHHLSQGWSDYRSRLIDNDDAAALLQRTPPDAASVPLTSSPTGTLIGSHGSIPSTPRSNKGNHGVDWLPKFVHRDAYGGSRTSLSSGSSRTGWGKAFHQEDDGDLRYSHDMANQYFQVPGGSRSWARGGEAAHEQLAGSQRIMHRMASVYPLPCDDQEQQVSSPSLQTIVERGAHTPTSVSTIKYPFIL